MDIAKAFAWLKPGGGSNVSRTADGHPEIFVANESERIAALRFMVKRVSEDTVGEFEVPQVCTTQGQYQSYHMPFEAVVEKTTCEVRVRREQLAAVLNASTGEMVSLALAKEAVRVEHPWVQEANGYAEGDRLYSMVLVRDSSGDIALLSGDIAAVKALTPAQTQTIQDPAASSQEEEMLLEEEEEELLE